MQTPEERQFVEELGDALFAYARLKPMLDDEGFAMFSKMYLWLIGRIRQCSPDLDSTDVAIVAMLVLRKWGEDLSKRTGLIQN